MIRIDGDVRIREEYLQPQAPVSRIAQGFDERIGGREPLALELLFDPGEEHLNLRFAVGQPVQLLVGIHKVVFSNVLFDGVKRLDLFKGLADAGGFGLEGFEDLAARVRLILCSR